MRRRLLSAAFVALLALPLSLPSSKGASQLLTNGDFEAGSSGWAGIALAASGCPARSGSGALALTASSGHPAVASQSIDTAAVPGSHDLTGYARVGSAGPLSMNVSLQWLDRDGVVLSEYVGNPAPGQSYAPFEVTSPFAPVGAAAIAVRLRVEGNGLACFDDLVLSGPSPITATPVPPSTTPAPSATVTGSAEESVSPTSTMPSTRTGTPAPAVTDRIINGGFEDGTASWQKFGGELVLVRNPVHSGANAGSLVSTTSSTKWAYQVVHVDGGKTYAFDGYIWPDGGVAEAYLRISWYASDDAGGTAVATSDSVNRVNGHADGYVHVTTNAVAAPQAAHSARVRVMLAPSGSDSAVVYMDDLNFGPAEIAATVTSTARPTENASSSGGAAGSPQGPSPSATTAPLAAVRSTPAAYSEVKSQEAAPMLSGPEGASNLKGGNSGGRSTGLSVLIFAVLAVSAMAATVVAVRRFSPPA